jgi:hypothetical protein
MRRTPRRYFVETIIPVLPPQIGMIIAASDIAVIRATSRWWWRSPAGLQCRPNEEGSMTRSHRVMAALGGFAMLWVSMVFAVGPPDLPTPEE